MSSDDLELIELIKKWREVALIEKEEDPAVALAYHRCASDLIDVLKHRPCLHAKGVVSLESAHWAYCPDCDTMLPSHCDTTEEHDP